MGKTRYFRARIYDPEDYDVPAAACCSRWHTSWQAAEHCGDDYRRVHYFGAASMRIEEKR